MTVGIRSIRAFFGRAASEPRFLEGQSDAKLLTLARDGNQRACTELFARHGERLFSIVEAAHSDLGVTEDLVQDSFLRAIRSAHQLREATSFFPWLVRIAMNLAHDHRHKRRRETLTAATPERVSDVLHDEQIADAEDAARVRAALDILRPRARQILVLRYFSSFSIAEIAEVVDKSEVAVRKELQRARQALADELGDWFEVSR